MTEWLPVGGNIYFALMRRYIAIWNDLWFRANEQFQMLSMRQL